MQLIADTAGYSKYVVSKTLNGKPGVSEGTRQKILFVAKQLGYFKEKEAGQGSSLAERAEAPDGFILIVMPYHNPKHTESDYWSQILQGVTKYLDELGVGVIIISNQKHLSDKVTMSSLLGIITVGYVATEMLLEFNSYRVPIVMVDHEEPLIKTDTIFMDNIEGVSKITAHLIGLGHKRMRFVTDLSHSSSFYDRWIGFWSTIEKYGIDSKKQRFNEPSV